jgi:hypothetical protein
MLSNAKLTVGVVTSLLVGAVATTWALSRDLVTQAQLAAAVTGMDLKLGPIAGQIEKVADKVANVDTRLSRLEGRMESSPR